MLITVNGKKFDLDEYPLEKFLKDHEYRPERIAVECNGNILPKSMYAEKILHDGDVLEIISFVGGG